MGVPSLSPQTARAGSAPDMFHVPPYAMSMKTSARFVEDPGDLRVPVEAIVALRMNERAVLVEHLGRGHGAPVLAEIGRHRDHHALAVRPDLHTPHALLEVIGHVEGGRSGRREIACARGIRSLRRLERVDDLGNDGMQVRVALAVGVAHRVDRSAVHEECDVGPVVEVKTTHEVLLRLAAPRVLHREETWNRLEDVLRAQARAQAELRLPRRRVGGGGALGLEDGTRCGSFFR